MKWHVKVFHPETHQLLREYENINNQKAVVDCINQSLEENEIPLRVSFQEISYLCSPSVRADKYRKNINKLSEWIILEKTYYRAEPKVRSKNATKNKVLPQSVESQAISC